LTACAFAKKIGISESGLCNILCGRRQNNKVQLVVDRFIEKQFSKLGLQAASFVNPK
jgi:hypothetical protein